MQSVWDALQGSGNSIDRGLSTCNVQKTRTEMLKSYNQSDFTLEKYEEYLNRILDQGYTFRRYTNFDKNEKFVIQRHDIDFSPANALDLALIEARYDISATYAVLTNSPFYNLFEKEVKKAITEIIDLGHDIALHFDPIAYDLKESSQLATCLNFEKTIIKELFGTNVRVFAFHMTTPISSVSTDWEYGGLINCYASYFRDCVAYCSDSNGYWRHSRLEDFIEAGHDRMVILTHPLWWSDTILMPREKILNCVSERSEATVTEYDSLLSALGRENIGLM